jgi:hypothetical protein
MSAILFQIQAIRKICREQWLATADLSGAAAALKEITAEVDRTLENRLEAEEQQGWERWDF